MSLIHGMSNTDVLCWWLAWPIVNPSQTQCICIWRPGNETQHLKHCSVNCCQLFNKNQSVKRKWVSTCLSRYSNKTWWGVVRRHWFVIRGHKQKRLGTTYVRLWENGLSSSWGNYDVCLHPLQQSLHQRAVLMHV